MNNYSFCKTHVHRAALLIAFYAFALSLLNAKTLVAIVFNISNVFSPHSNEQAELDADLLVNTARRVYFLYSQTTPDSRSLAYLNIFISGVCCLLLAYGNRENRPGYYYPFIALCIYKIMYCASEVLESTMIILHKVPLLRIDHQASTIHFILCIGASVIVTLFIWCYFMDIIFRAKRFMQDELLDPFTQLPRIHINNANLLAGIRIENLSESRSSNLSPPPYDWKPGDAIEQRSAVVPAYHP